MIDVFQKKVYSFALSNRAVCNKQIINLKVAPVTYQGI